MLFGWHHSGKLSHDSKMCTSCETNLTHSQLVMYVFRMGIISSLLSETLVSGFTTGAAIHVLTSQVKDLFGMNIKSKPGYFKLIFVS